MADSTRPQRDAPPTAAAAQQIQIIRKEPTQREEEIVKHRNRTTPPPAGAAVWDHTISSAPVTERSNNEATNNGLIGVRITLPFSPPNNDNDSYKINGPRDIINMNMNEQGTPQEEEPKATDAKVDEGERSALIEKAMSILRDRAAASALAAAEGPKSSRDRQNILLAKRFRSVMCNNVEDCPFGTWWCMFAHSKEDLRTIEENAEEGLATMSAVDAFRNAHFNEALTEAISEGDRKSVV